MSVPRNQMGTRNIDKTLFISLLLTVISILKLRSDREFRILLFLFKE